MKVYITYYENKTGRIKDGTVLHVKCENVKHFSYDPVYNTAYVIDDTGNCVKYERVEGLSIDA